MTREEREVWEGLDDDERLDAYRDALDNLRDMEGRYKVVRAQLNAAVEARRKAVASDGLLAVRISALETCIKRILLENDRDGVRARFDHAREFLAANSAPSATHDGGGKDGGR